MKIGIDATSLYRKTTGIESYTLSLIKSLLSCGEENTYVVFFRETPHPEIMKYKKEAKFVVSPKLNQIICEQIWLPIACSNKKVDIMHFPAFPPALFTTKKYVFTIHDATMWKYANTLSWKNKLYIKPLSNVAVNKAERIIAVSESSKRDIVKYCHINDSKIVNTGESIGENFKIINDKEYLERIKIRYELPNRFILSVCSLEPRKNLPVLLESFKKFKKINPEATDKLVLVGRKAWGSNEIIKKIRELDLDSEVIITGHVTAEELVGIYNLANLFVYPSIYEGFGLPPLEAMACGVPVIASNTSAMPEVLNGAAILVNPLDSDQIASKMAGVLVDSSLREELRKKGLERVKQFSWEEVARKTIQVYESVK